MIRYAVAIAILLSAWKVWATTVYVTSVGASEVQIIVNGQAVRSLRVGETSPEGVRLDDVQAGVATLVVDGRAMQMRIGQSTVSQVVLTADAQGHFFTTARINGSPVRALIDTGATDISISVAEAVRLGIDYARGRPVVARTANGSITVYQVNLPHVQVGDIAFTNVAGSVRPDSASPALIGMSFLRLVEMRRSGNTMTLLRADR